MVNLSKASKINWHGWTTVDGGHRFCLRCYTTDYCICYWCPSCEDFCPGQPQGHYIRDRGSKIFYYNCPAKKEDNIA